MADLNLISLTLCNFKAFSGEHSLKLAQRSGLYHVSGRNLAAPELGANGVGKTTIWDALLWVLWGKTGRDGKPGAAITPWGGGEGNKDFVQVELRFKRGDKEHWLVRGRGPNRLELYEDDAPHAITQEDIPRLLGMSEEMFRRTMILAQFGTLFLDMKADQQTSMFSEALALDQWLSAAAVAGMSAKEAGEKVRTLEREGAELQSVCAELEAQMKEARLRADAFEEELEKDIADQRAIVAALDKQIAKVRAKLGVPPKEPTPDAKIARLSEKILAESSHLNRETEDATRKLGENGGKCSKCGQPIKNEKLLDKIAALQDASRLRVKAWHDDIRELQATRNEANLAFQKERDAFRVRERELDDLIRAVERGERSIKELKEAPNTEEQAYERFKTRRQEKRMRRSELTADLAKANLRLSQAEFWVKAFKEIRLSIIDEVLVELEVAAQRHAALLGLVGWRIKFQTERVNTSGQTSYAFTVLLFPPGEDGAIKWESYSGGESQRWQLAVAFGLSEVLLSRAGVDPNIEVLDEPTRGLSSEGIADLLEHLRDRALDLGRAIYLVDHHALDKGAFDGVLMVERNKKGSAFAWV